MHKSLAANDKLILALDGLSKNEAYDLADNIPNLRWVKIGLELFMNSGLEGILEFRKKGLKVFLDLKFHDIPITMSSACYQAARTGAELITVHACAGFNALKEANHAAIKGASELGLAPPRLLAVTVLTSWEEKKFASELMINQPLEQRVEHLAKLALRAGIGGCVCSPLEVQNLRNLCPNSFELVTPGIRSKDSELGDQVRVMTPSKALNAGASRLVVGRPITKANNPADAFISFCRDMEMS